MKSGLTTLQASVIAHVARSTIISAINRARLTAEWSQQFRCWIIQPADLERWQNNHNPKGGYPKGLPRKIK